MGMNLDGKGGYYSFGDWSWFAMLDLAQCYGWQPAGTEPPNARFTAWNGAYTYATGQLVTRQDARNLADALDKALADISRDDQRGESAQIAEQIIAHFFGANPNGALHLAALKARLAGLWPPNPEEVEPDEPDDTPPYLPPGKHAPLAEILRSFSGPSRRTIIEGFVAYCRQGEFRLW